MSDVDLKGANMSRANIAGADPWKANMTGAKNVTWAQIKSTRSYERATLPDYLMHRPTPELEIIV